ncbi:MAG: hypothetical protein IK093_09230, partial [Ruminiclostridium sp.]|nr:hypothetical protein [Ruminiclostridium sp.]
MKKKKADPLMIAIYAMLVIVALYMAAALGTAMDLSVDDNGKLNFNVFMPNIEAALSSPDIVFAHLRDKSGYSGKITLLVGVGIGIYALMVNTSKKRL